jgi:hypothetical protein
MFTSQLFIDTRTGEIVDSILLSQIQHFEEYNGHLQAGDFASIAGEGSSNESDN